ncbi:MAG: cob(I)yrinic acid a,c-diamide adenosyltransferase [Patescibacteria group bacterium]
MTRIYTRTGDKGLTSLYGGQRVPKFKTRVAVFGSLDELNASLGVALSGITDEDIQKTLLEIQNTLFNIGAEAAEGGTKAKKMIDDALRVGPMQVAKLERWIDAFEQELEPLNAFILPGGSGPGAQLHLARAVCRRAERRLSALGEEETVNPASLMYLNRLSDLLFVLARAVNHRAGVPEQTWRK